MAHLLLFVHHSIQSRIRIGNLLCQPGVLIHQSLYHESLFVHHDILSTTPALHRFCQCNPLPLDSTILGSTKTPKNTQEGQLLFLVHKYLFRA
jgi:hypothetical protein